MADCTATIRSAPDNSLAYARNAPGMNGLILGYFPNGVSGYRVLELRLDSTGFAWLRLDVLAGVGAWVKSDRINIVGDCSTVGYGVVAQPTQASSLTRNETPKNPQPQPPKPTPPPTPTPIPAPPPSDSLARVRAAAFNITSGFEGGAYDTYQTYDAGIVSYGRFGFTLASGSLFSVLDRYLSKATSSVAGQLRTLYLQRVHDRDASLRTDTILRDLLRAAAPDAIMQAAQNDIATELYWNVIRDVSIVPRNITLPLSMAFLFDTGINNGVYHSMITDAEQALHVPSHSRVPDNGISEQQLLIKVASIRHDLLYNIANSRNLPGLKPRADFWVGIMQAGDWNLQGDGGGNVLIKTGRSVQVRNP